jgi:lipoprotein LprG
VRRPARLSAAVATVAVVALLGACQGGGDKAAQKPAASSSSAQSPTPTPTPTGPVVLTAATFADAIGEAAKGDTSYDFGMTMTVSGQAISAQGSGATVGGAPSVAMTMDMSAQGAGTMALRMVDGKVYMSMTQVTGDKFFVIDPNDPSSPLAGTADELTGQTDPVKSIAQLKGAIVSVTPSGAPEQLDGVAAQPYDVTVDTTKMADVQAQAKTANVTLPATLSYRYWVGPDNLPRKLSMSLLGTQTDMTFSHWGAGAPITAPTADQITASPF